MKTVLIVEDEEVLSDLLVNLLEEEGYRAISAPNGKVGLNTISKAQPDLIITDMMMPLLDGLGLCRALRSMPEYHAIPLILLSAISDRVKGSDCSWSAVVSKPFDADKLLRTVSNLIGNA